MPNVTALRPDDPRRVGRYRLTGRVDEFAGSEARSVAVFLAQRVDGEPVMVTLLAADRAADAAARDRFSAEARVARRVPPFCVAKILDAGFEGGRPYLITESARGPTLAQAVALEGPLPAAKLRALAIGCVTGIAAIHQAGLVHGQFGPEMVVLGRDGPRVVHFSITPPYGTATPAADMLAWARAMLFAAGRPSAEPQDLMRLPDGLRSVLADCLAPDPAGRPLARAVLAELLTGQDLSAGLLAAGSRQARAAAHTPVRTAAPPGRQAPRRARSRAAAWGAGCAACILAIAAAAFYIAGRHAPPPAATHRTTKGANSRHPAHRGIPTQFAGSWSGTVHQTNPELSVTVQITLAGGTTHGTIGYPQLGCSGKLGLLSAGHGLLTLGLKITSGQNNCVSGKVRLTAEKDGTLDFTFLQRGGDNPTGSLGRVF